MLLEFISLFFTSLLSATLLPGGAEAVLLYLLNATPSHWLSILFVATIGNSLGSYLTYLLGSLGKTGWATRYLGISPKQLEKALAIIDKKGHWMSFFVFCQSLETP